MTAQVIDLNRYLSLGRAQLAARDEAARKAEEAEHREHLRRIREAWEDLIGKVSASIPEFLSFMVEPTEHPNTYTSPGKYRPLVFDLTPLGLEKVGAFEYGHCDTGLAWMPPEIVEQWDFETEEYTGIKYLALQESYAYGELSRAYTFFECIAVTADRMAEVAKHNAWVTSPKPVEEVKAPVMVPLPERIAKGGGVYPVLHMGFNRAEVHEIGAAKAEEFGYYFGVSDWRDTCAVHTFTVRGVPALNHNGLQVGTFDLHAYVTLVPVAPHKWAEVFGAPGQVDPTEVAPEAN